jgi:hypothetical protein
VYDRGGWHFRQARQLEDVLHGGQVVVDAGCDLVRRQAEDRDGEAQRGA